jgi:hypothetical protein
VNEDQLETWKNVTAGRFVLVRMSALGQRTHEMINAGRTFHLTPAERRVNQELVANDDQDPFMDGTLQPVRLLEGTEENIVKNPNHLSDEDVRTMFGLHWKTFEARVKEITNPSTLERLLQVARESETEATVRQVEAVQMQLREVAPPLFETVEVLSSGAPNTGPEGIRPVTPH